MKRQAFDGLVLIGGGDPAAPMPWIHLNGEGEVVARGESLEGERAGLRATAPSRTALVLRASEAQLRRTSLPARTQAQARAAVALMFEDEVAGAALMHYAVGAAQDVDGDRLVAAIESERLAAWLARCRKSGVDPHTVALDCTVYPSDDNGVEVAEDADRVILAGGNAGGLSLEPGLARVLAPQWIARSGMNVRGVGYSGQNFESFRGALDSFQVVDRGRGDINLSLARGVMTAGDRAPNFRQGPFAPRGRRAGVGGWWLVAVLAALSILLNVAIQTYGGWREMQASERTVARAEAVFRAARPDIRRIANLRSQVAALSTSAARAERHPVLTTADPIVRALQATPGVRVDELHYRGPESSVRVNVSSMDPAALQAFTAHLQSQGLTLHTETRSPVNGRLILGVTLEAAR